MNPGNHAAYQDTFVSEFHKFYHDPFVRPKSTWDYIVQLWYLDLSQANSIIFRLYHRQFLSVSCSKGLINPDHLALADDDTLVRTAKGQQNIGKRI